jgi:hypothetical protein
MHELSGEPRRHHDTAPISLLPRGWFDTQADAGSLVRAERRLKGLQG